MASTTIKLTTATRDRLRAFGGETYEATIIEALDELENRRFWSQAAAAAAWREGLTESERAERIRHEGDVDAAFDGIE